MGDALSREQLKRLERHGCRYPWDPRDMLRLIEEMAERDRALGEMRRIASRWKGIADHLAHEVLARLRAISGEGE